MIYDPLNKDAIKLMLCDEVNWLISTKFPSINQAARRLNVHRTRLSRLRNRDVTTFSFETLLGYYVLLGGKAIVSVKDRSLIY